MSGKMIQAEKVLRIGQRVEFDAENDGKRYTSRIEDILPDRLFVAMPVDAKRRPVLPEPDSKVCGRIITDKCVYRFFAVYKERCADPIPIWKITKPVLLERWQRRRFVRVPARLALTVQIINEEGQLGQSVETTLVDLSGNGVCFSYPSLVHVGCRAVLDIEPLPDIGNLQLVSKVTKCVPVETPLAVVYHVGVEFENMERSVQNKLVRFIFELQRKLLTIQRSES